CRLINILHPGCVWKINRGASPIAGLDNLGAFLRGCASLGLGVSQLFDPGDLQDPTTRHTLTSSEANRSVKNVLVTIYWLGRAASKLPQYHGAPLNRKAFATLLAQSEETDETDSVLGSSWELEQSDTPSPHSCPQSHSDSLRPHDRVCCSLDSEH
uniref:Calponin-homology (CH) domain-containing protein n=1 Tax=Eptatretus burgeri TaxID=7764 RepID=A0A8C4QYB5_EPTBU